MGESSWRLGNWCVTLKDKRTGKAYKVLAYSQYHQAGHFSYTYSLAGFPWMNSKEKAVIGKVAYMVYQKLEKQARESMHAQQREEMFKEFGRKG